MSSAPEGTYVLVVDDEPDVLNIVETQLERTGYGVLTAESGLEALRVLRGRTEPLRSRLSS